MELKKTTKRLAASDESRDGAFEQARELAKKLAATQKEFARVMAEKDAAMQQERLALEERHHAELAAALGQAPGASQTDEDAAHTRHLMARVQVGQRTTKRRRGPPTASTTLPTPTHRSSKTRDRSISHTHTHPHTHTHTHTPTGAGRPK